MLSFFLENCVIPDDGENGIKIRLNYSAASPAAYLYGTLS